MNEVRYGKGRAKFLLKKKIFMCAPIKRRVYTVNDGLFKYTSFSHFFIPLLNVNPIQVLFIYYIGHRYCILKKKNNPHAHKTLQYNASRNGRCSTRIQEVNATIYQLY